MASKHDKTALKLARKFKTPYNRGQGPDINTTQQAIEVETKDTVADGLRQLRGFQKPVYIAGAAPEATQAALERTQGTTVGVRDQDGNILKQSTRKR